MTAAHETRRIGRPLPYDLEHRVLKVQPGDLTRFVSSLFAERGMNAADSRIVAEVLVWADMRGTASHGVGRVGGYLSMIDKGQMDPAARPRIAADLGAIFSIEAQRSAGPVAMVQALASAQDRARRFGIGMGLVGRTTHTGAIGFYAERAARQGFAAIVMAAGPPIMAYQNASIASLSTAPLAVAVPGGPDGVILLDMASSVVSNGRLKQAAQAGETIPEGWALDSTGEPTRDAAKAAIPLPMAGPKGTGLALMIECLTSVLAAAPIISTMVGPAGKRSHVQNATIILIDIARFRSVADYTSDIDALAVIVHSLPAIDSREAIRLPGERGAAAASRSENEGVRIGDKTWRALADLAKARGIQPPGALGE